MDENNLPHIVVPAHLPSLQKSIAFVSSFAKAAGFELKRTREIELCVEEVLVNIFHYAYPGKGGQVTIACGRGDDGTLVIRIQDEGIPFNILSVSDPDITADIDERQIGGLGIYFVRQLMDGVEYRREANRNILTLSVQPPAPQEGRERNS